MARSLVLISVVAFLSLTHSGFFFLPPSSENFAAKTLAVFNYCCNCAPVDMYATVSLRMTDRSTAMMRRERMDGFETRIWVTANNHLRKLLRWFESAILLRDSRIGSWTGAPFPTFHSTEEKSVTYFLPMVLDSMVVESSCYVRFHRIPMLFFRSLFRADAFLTLLLRFADSLRGHLHNFSDTFLSQIVNVLDICKFRCSCESSDFASIKVLQLLYTFLTLQFAPKFSNSISILVSR